MNTLLLCRFDSKTRNDLKRIISNASVINPMFLDTSNCKITILKTRATEADINTELSELTPKLEYFLINITSINLLYQFPKHVNDAIKAFMSTNCVDNINIDYQLRQAINSEDYTEAIRLRELMNNR